VLVEVLSALRRLVVSGEATASIVSYPSALT
jgi:hypothetical protein